MSYETIWKSIIRPPRENYTLSSLGPVYFRLRSRNYKRKDINLHNSRGLQIQCSHFKPIRKERVANELPCVIYLHCNAGSRLEPLTLIKRLLTSNITVFTFDFSGCGISEGEFITLGLQEKEDLTTVVNYLRNTGTVSLIGLWGRSMGAVTALLYGEHDPSIAAIVADSPFASLKLVIKEQAKKYSKMPGFIINIARKIVRKTIMKKAGFNIDDVSPINCVDKCYIPILLCHAIGDKFIPPHHTEHLFDKYAGEKDRLLVEGDHNSTRPDFFLDSVAIFFYNALQCDILPAPAEVAKKKKSKKLPKEVNQVAVSLFQQQLDLEDQMLKSMRP